ncbi:DUF4403 family protein [Flavobacterium xueshanense]|uniref:DUF4403 family protein n=1 Tax=Flavobacterium xueshanense TaxID=935223 RepID=A0A1I1ZBK5_9FLAO|nr:DUF4403 family protein [Flavobacterium xueshanense]SFE29065.1 protein of unknown function [Flavobacterium xueshanense]
MLKFTFTLLLLSSILFVSSCATTNKINALKPEPDDATPLIYENTPSYINMPISVKLKDVENQTNAVLSGLIYEDNNIEDDDIEMKVWKLASITIKNETGGKGEKIRTILPLRAIVKYRIGTKKMGVEMYDTREFNLDGVVTLVSEVTLINWKLNTKTELKSLDWNESPTITVFGKNVPVTYLINSGVKLFKSKIEKKIDDAIVKAMDFKPNVLAALEKICVPFLMNDTYESWLRIVPIEIYSTNAKLKNDAFVLEMGMKCNMETLMGKQPESKFNASKIILKPVTKIPEDITANIVAISTYQEASKIMTKNFAGQVFGSGSQKVKVQNVTIWHKKGKMIIALEVLGSVNGTIYLAGFPQYNDKTKEVFFDQLDYVLDTKNKLMRTANWLAQGLVLKKIEQSCRYSIKPNLEEGQKSMMTYLKNYSPMQGVFVNGKIEEIQFQKVQLTNQAIIAFIKVKGTVNVSVNGLK